MQSCPVLSQVRAVSALSNAEILLHHDSQHFINVCWMDLFRSIACAVDTRALFDITGSTGNMEKGSEDLEP